MLLDEALINMYTTPTARVRMQNVSAGSHTLTVVPALNDHAEVTDNAQSIKFRYEPTHPLAPIGGAVVAGDPSVRIVSPTDGASVSGAFTLKVAFSSFIPSVPLMGKGYVLGFGHWHVNLDSMSGPMMGMGTMLGMSGARTFLVSTAGLKPGSTHTLSPC